MAQQLLFTSEPKQNFIINLENGEVVSLFFWYMAISSSWYLVSFTYNEKTRYINKRVALNHNLLSSFYNLIPFGLICLSDDNIDPTFLDDFETGRTTLTITAKEETKLIEDALFSNNS